MLYINEIRKIEKFLFSLIYPFSVFLTLFFSLESIFRLTVCEFVNLLSIDDFSSEFVAEIKLPYKLVNEGVGFGDLASLLTDEFDGAMTGSGLVIWGEADVDPIDFFFVFSDLSKPTSIVLFGVDSSKFSDFTFDKSILFDPTFEFEFVEPDGDAIELFDEILLDLFNFFFGINFVVSLWWTWVINCLGGDESLSGLDSGVALSFGIGLKAGICFIFEPS